MTTFVNATTVHGRGRVESKYVDIVKKENIPVDVGGKWWESAQDDLHQQVSIDGQVDDNELHQHRTKVAIARKNLKQGLGVKSSEF